MNYIYILLVLQCVALTVSADEDESRVLDYDDDDLGRKHKKRKKHQNSGPCGYGRSLGEKLFGSQQYTYVSAPVNNYYFGCGGLPSYPLNNDQQYGHVGHGGHGGHGSHGGHGHGGHGHGHHGNHGGFNQGYGGYGQGYGGGPGSYGPYNQQYQRPFQGVVSAAASGFGTALTDYFNRPKKSQKHINKQVNQLLRPIYKLF